MHTGFIYKIVADNTDKVYYGSTTLTLNKRMIAHRNDLTCSSEYLFEYPNTRIELLETHHHVDKDTLKQILIEVERGYIERFRKYRPGRCVNKLLPIRTANEKKEYHKKYNIENVDKKKEYNDKYRIDNTDKMKEQRKKYYYDNTDKLRERVKQYRLDYADEIKKRKKQYYDNNANKISQQKRLSYLAKIINKTYLNILYNVYINNE